MEHVLDGVIASGWEIFEDETSNTRLVFHFGENLKSVEDKLYSRDLILDYEKTISYEKSGDNK